MVGDGVGGAGGCWCVVEFVHAVGAGKFLEDDCDGGGVGCVIVGLLAANGLEGWADFAAPVMAGCDVDVGEEDKS